MRLAAYMAMAAILWPAYILAQQNVVAGYVLTGSSRLDHLAGRKDPVPVPSAKEIVIPLKRSGKLLLIEAEVDGIKGDFIFDTGAPYLVLNQTYFRTEQTNRAITAGGITGGSAYQQSRSVAKLSMRGVEYFQLQADLTPLGHIEDARGVKILGLLGMNLFKAFEMEIDVRSSTLRLRETARNGDTHITGKESYDMEHPVLIMNNAIIVSCTIAGKRITCVLDTGAELNTLGVHCGKKVVETVAIQGRSQLMGTGSAKVEVLYGTMKEFAMGNTSFTGMRTLLTQMGDMGTAYGTPIDGMLGYEFLSKGIVVVNFRQKVLRMKFFDNIAQ